MQKSILGYGKTSAGKYRSLLVDDLGHLIIELGTGAASTQTGNDPVQAVYSEPVGPEGEDHWIEHIWAYNPTRTDTTLQIGSTPGSGDVVAATVVEAGQGELLTILKRTPEEMHLSLRGTITLNTYTRRYYKLR